MANKFFAWLSRAWERYLEQSALIYFGAVVVPAPENTEEVEVTYFSSFPYDGC